MNVHQVLTGALNTKDFLFSVGLVEGNKFIVCAVGVNVVILTSTFFRIQVINSSKSEVLVKALNCCNDSGKIAVSYGDTVRIFEPVLASDGKNFPYIWHETQSIDHSNPVDYLEWILEGLRLVVLSNRRLCLYQHKYLTNVVSSATNRTAVAFSINEDFKIAVHSEEFWEIVWSTELSSKPKFVRFSPDSTVFATCGEDDKFVKIWYPIEDHAHTGAVEFSFIYLQHPSQVFGFEWRRTSKYVPRKCVSNVILTWCADNVSRIWKQTPSVNDTVEQLLSAVQVVQDKPYRKKVNGKQNTLKKARTRLVTKINKLMHTKNTSNATNRPKNAEFGRVATFADFSIPVATPNINFNLAATISSETDCFLVPSMETRDSRQMTFAVHWFNNKEMMFTHGAEKILAEALFGEHSETGQRSGTVSVDLASPIVSHEGTPNTDMLSPIAADISTVSNSSTAHSTDLEAARDLLDLKIEGLIQQWNKSPDVLFAVHPVDGSLLTWMIEWLDDEWRQSVVSFTSRTPNAFPLSDAASTNLSLSVFSPQDANLNDLQRQFGEHAEEDPAYQGNVASLLTSHKNGSLNLWQLFLEDNQSYNNIVNVIHRYRMCGHRFQTDHISAHPMLPLVLTSGCLPESNNTAGESELILWKVNPVGPLCKSGGIRELSRVTTERANAFKCLSWIPAIIPSFANGTVCNSPSSCFITSRDNKLSVYQAVVDARGLLSELFAENRPESRAESRSSNESNTPPHQNNHRVNLNDMFNIVSTQSTGRPGCIIHLADVIDGEIGEDEILLLHVFNEALMSDFEETEVDEDVIENFLILLVQKLKDGATVIRLWSLSVKLQSPVNVNGEDEIKQTRRFSVGGPEFYATATDVPSTVAKLAIITKKLFDQKIDLPEGVSVSEVVTCAGHLPSSSVYPACRSPYFLIVSCDDNYLRFLRCIKDKNGSEEVYKWESWGMISDSFDSTLPIPGSICSLASAHSGRFACVYKPITSPISVDIAGFCRELCVSVYECETSGGVEWLQEEKVLLQDCFGAQYRKLLESLLFCGSEDSLLAGSKDLVRIDWASTEDGAHILTVGVANLIFFFAQMSQNKAQQNVAIMQESHEQYKRPPLRRDSSLASDFQVQQNSLVKWVCVRYIALESVDGLPPLPTMMSWVRDGLFVVGMPSEMRIYSQWNMIPLKAHVEPESTEPVKSGIAPKTVKILGIRPVASATNLSMSPSHSMLDTLLKKSSKLQLEFKPEPKQVNLPIKPLADNLLDEGVFEAARLANPMLPQYHPKQLIEMLNAGKTKRVKAILLHVLKALKQNQSSTKSKFSRAASLRRINSSKDSDGVNDKNALSRQRSVTMIDDEDLEYEELEGIPPLPLHALLAVDDEDVGEEKAANLGEQDNVYDTLFNEEESDEDLDEALDKIQEDAQSRSSRMRHSSTGSETRVVNPHSFTARHSRALTELLTHTHLPGLSSVDQMHLLAMADTLSQFSQSAMDKLVQANAPFKPSTQNELVDTAASGYANSGTGMETVDECGLRFLMAMKQHEYLLLCLPRVQKQRLRLKGMPTSQIIWAFHSDAENELLSAIPCCQKGQETWDSLKAYGVAWWLKNNTTLRLIMEKVAKASFQANQDPMDAALFYLAMRKKNVLTHLFKTVNDQRMHDFFREDFNSDRWRKAALKNAFVLMSKQRYQNAAAFFLLGNSLGDAIEAILSRLKDLQLAMVVIRLYETDPEKQTTLMEQMLCKKIFGLPSTELHENCKFGQTKELTRFSVSSADPFERSMVLWMVKEYAMATSVLVEEAAGSTTHVSGEVPSLSDIFNFYSFLHRNPLVIRQRLTNAGVQVASTEKFLAFSRHLESRVTPQERRLYFRTAAAHMASGCPLLALDVLSVLPRRIVLGVDAAFSNMETSGKELEKVESVSNVDWSAPTNVVEDDDLKLEWSDNEENDEEEQEEQNPFTESKTNISTVDVQVSNFQLESDESNENDAKMSVDFIAQHMKFIAALKMMADELSTLASGFEIDGGELRHELLKWLIKESAVLFEICDHQSETHETAKGDPTEFLADPIERRKWLLKNQKLIRTFTTYCLLHSAQNHRLTSVLMELILLLLEIQQEANGLLDVNVLQTRAFPLFSASVSVCRMFVTSPLNFLEDQCTDLLLTISQFKRPPPFGIPFSLVRKVYNLCQGLSSCLYQSLSSIEKFQERILSEDDLAIRTSPHNWPGVDSLLALMSAGRDEDTPNLRLLLIKIFVSVSASLFAYALAGYDSRWLYRLSVRNVDSIGYGFIFGGGGEKVIRQPPARPAPPPRPQQPDQADKSRTSFHTKMLKTIENKPKEQIISCWLPPKKHLVQYFAEKVQPDNHAPNEVIFDSDQSESDFSDEEDDFDKDLEIMAKPHKDPSSYAWLLIRFACVTQQYERLKQFIQVAGFDFSEIVRLSPHVHNIVKLFNNWSIQLQTQIENYPEGCPIGFLPNMYYSDENATVTTTTNNLNSGNPLLKKYKFLVESNNTPFEYTGRGVLAVKRLWAYLVRQDNLASYFVRYIYARSSQNVDAKDKITVGSVSSGSQYGREINETLRIIQREREAIISFACSNVKPGHMVLSTGREVQELNLENLLSDKEDRRELKSIGNFLNNRVDLDIALEEASLDRLKDNDDYQLIGSSKGTALTGSSFLQKRHIGGVRRIEAHPTLPYYVTGASDGSIYLWEWNTDQAVFTARVAGQHAKVTRLAFAQNGNKFASVDGDGHLCIWQATQQVASKKPFFNQKCHTKSASDLKFLGQTSSVLVTAGHSQGDMNVVLWDTLLPQSRSMVYAFHGHVEGATCVSYFTNSQTIVSGGKQGEICLWDLRQRQLRATVKAFDSASVRSMYSYPGSNLLVTGSSEGDIKIWDINALPQLLHTMTGEHSVKGGFSLRQVGSSAVQGVQQVYVDPEMRLFSCGSDCSLKIRTLPTF